MVAKPTLISVLDALDFDTRSGVELCGGDPDFYSDLIRELYEDVLPPSADALKASDVQQQRELAHKLKGTFSTLGALKASKAAFELEQALREGRTDTTLAGILLREITRIRQELSVVFEQ